MIGLGGPTATIVDGGGAGPVVRFDAGQTANARLQGLTIRNGTATIGAGGIQASGSTPTIEDCIVTLNHGKFGGGVSGSPTMRRCAILQNGASLAHGGGVYGSPNMEDCVVAQNTVSSADGGGLYLTGGTCEIRNCFVVANTIIQGDPAHGAGVTVHSSATVHLDHCVVANNRAFGNVFGSYGGGVWATPTTTIESCTIVGNLAQNGNATGGGVYGAAKIVNSIVRGNTPDELAGSPVVTWSNVLGGYAGVGNVDGVPRFVDEFGTVDLHLLPNSPCIDRGDPAKFDADGTRSDIGAFAYQRLYTRGNGIAWSLDEASFAAISTATGGRQVMRLALGADGTGDVYLLLGSMSGTAPGVPLGSVTLPLVQDAYTDATLLAPGSVGLVGTLGVLGANGTGEASFAPRTSPRRSPAVAPRRAHRRPRDLRGRDDERAASRARAVDPSDGPPPVMEKARGREVLDRVLALASARCVPRSCRAYPSGGLDLRREGALRTASSSWGAGSAVRPARACRRPSASASPAAAADPRRARA
ncbi:MAG: right-handed parallel beta-helix repeat-containing protein [Planctomycetota bacterium]